MLNQKLKELEAFGEIYIMYTREYKWRAYIEMFTSGKGAEFKIRTELNFAEPEEAIGQLIERVGMTLNTLNVKRIENA